MTFILRYKHYLAALLLLISCYCVFDMYQLYQTSQLWAYRLLFFWCCSIASFVLFLLNKTNRTLLLSSLLSGVLFAGGFMQDYSFMLLFVAFVPILWIEQQINSTSKEPSVFRLFKYSYFSFFVWNILSTWWIQNSSLWAGILGNSLNAFFMCLPILAYHKTKKLLSVRAANLGFVAFWLSFEIGHLNWSLSWPWLTLGNSFANLPPLVQWYEYTGVFGGSLWILCVNLMFYHAFNSFQTTKKMDSVVRMQLIKAFVWVLLPTIFSVVLYLSHTVDTKESVEIVALQPNYEPHYQKFTVPQKTQFNAFIKLSKPMLDSTVDYLIFPETSFRNIDATQVEKAYPVQKLQNFIQDYPAINVVLGLSAFVNYQSGESMPDHVFTYCNDDKSFCQYYDHHNAAIQLNNQQSSIPYYKKSKLVPGAESMPFVGNIDLFKGLILDLGGAPGLSLGTQAYRDVFKSEAAKLGPLICYESIFGDYVTDYVKKGANLLTVITNDGWWDATAGHQQHLYLSSLRAIENRRFVVRAANSGTSAFINSRGDIYQQTTYNKAVAIRNKAYLHQEITLYTLYGDLIGRVSLLVSIWILCSMLAKRFGPKNS